MANVTELLYHCMKNRFNMQIISCFCINGNFNVQLVTPNNWKQTSKCYSMTNTTVIKSFINYLILYKSLPSIAFHKLTDYLWYVIHCA